MSQPTHSDIPLILRLVQESTGIVGVAGNIVRKVLHMGDLQIVDKGTDDLQTKADRAAQVFIMQELQKRFPQASIIGEEGDDLVENLDGLLSPPSTPGGEVGSTPFADILTKCIPDDLKNLQESEVVIWIDPLDGTGEFTKGLVSHVTILVGIAWNGKAVGGVIHQPFLKNGDTLGRTLWGIPGVGFGGFSVTLPPKGKRIVTTTRSHSNPKVEAALTSLEPDEILRVGGAGNKAILLMEGKAHAYVFASKGCKKWDTCAPEAVLVAMGGKLTDMDGNLYKYFKDVQHVNEGGILATAPEEDHEWYMKRILQQ